MRPGMGVTTPISSVLIFSDFFRIDRLTELLIKPIKYEQDSLMMHVEYESDLMNLTGIRTPTKLVLPEKQN